MVTELRTVNERLALYTTDDRLYKCLKKWSSTLYKVPYTQDGKLVGMDLYFDKQLENTVRQVIKGQLMLDL